MLDKYDKFAAKYLSRTPSAVMGTYVLLSLISALEEAFHFCFFFWNYMRLLMPKFYPFKYLREEHLSNYIYLKEWCLLQSHLEKEKIIFTQLFYIIEKEIDPHNTFMGRFELLPLQAYQTNNLNDPFICWK